MEKTNFGQLFVNTEINTVVKNHFGFINTDCDVVKSLLQGIVYTALDIPEIFDDERTTALNNLITKLVYG